MVKLPIQSKINNQTPPLIQTLENVIIATLSPLVTLLLLLVTHHPGQQPRPQAGVKHQLQQGQHDGVAVADVQAHLRHKSVNTNLLHLLIKWCHFMRDGALVLLPAPAPAGQRDEEERRPEHEERGREDGQHPDPGHALPPRPPQHARYKLSLDRGE